MLQNVAEPSTRARLRGFDSAAALQQARDELDALVAGARYQVSSRSHQADGP